MDFKSRAETLGFERRQDAGGLYAELFLIRDILLGAAPAVPEMPAAGRGLPSGSLLSC